MCEDLCRICGKTIKEKRPLNLFKNRKMLLQIEDLTGVRLKNISSLPKFMCCICKKDLIDAYKFREDFLKVQEAFIVNKRQKTNKKLSGTAEFVEVFNVKPKKNEVIYGLHEEKEINVVDLENLEKENIFKDIEIEVNALELKPREESEATAFVQVYTVKAEKNEVIYALDEEKEINVVDSETLQKKYIFRDIEDEVNSLELKHEDSKIATEEVITKVDTAYDTSEGLSEDNNDSDKKFNPETEKSKLTHKSKNSQCSSSESENSEIEEKKITNSLEKRKGDKNGKNKFICDQCGNHFNYSHHFQLHLRRHSGDKRSACELCPAKFFTTAELRRHMRRHTGERPFACRHCGRRFTDYSTRLKHERTHTNERPFMCSQCDKSFTTSYILKNHILTHTGERNFQCDVCNRAFTRRTELLVHFRSMLHKQAIEKEKCNDSSNRSQIGLSSEEKVTRKIFSENTETNGNEILYH